MFTKDNLAKHKHILNDDVFAKYEFFIDTPASVKGYCMRARTYTEAIVPLAELGTWGTHTFFYSSDQFPYYARVGQPCWGPLGGLKPDQTNLYVWCPTVRHTGTSTTPADPFYMYFKDLLKGMFKDGVDINQQLKFIEDFGLMLTPTVLEHYPSPIVVGFLMHRRYGTQLIDSSTTATVIARLVYSYMNQGDIVQTPYGPSDIVGTWDAVDNFVNGRFNVNLSKLSPFTKDPDYSCWDSPIKNLWTNHDIIGTGKFITGRATDINWDSWVERQPTNGAHWYGRNNGYTKDPKDGEVVKDIKKHLGVKYKQLSVADLTTKTSDFILERLNTYAKAA